MKAAVAELLGQQGPFRVLAALTGPSCSPCGACMLDGKQRKFHGLYHRHILTIHIPPSASPCRNAATRAAYGSADALFRIRSPASPAAHERQGGHAAAAPPRRVRNERRFNMRRLPSPHWPWPSSSKTRDTREILGAPSGRDARETVPRNWANLCDSVTDNFRVINPREFRVMR
jgi:hypothetical protein